MLTTEEVGIVADKLMRHYNIDFWLRFDKRKNGSYNCAKLIRLPTLTSFWLLCHEVAHAIDHQKYNWHNKKVHHNKSFRRIEKRVMQYCIKKNYWKEELDRRTTIPEPKPEPTKEEQRLNKIQHKKDLLQSYEKKLRYWNKLYTNKIRKCKRSIAALERSSISIQDSQVLLSSAHVSSARTQGQS